MAIIVIRKQCLRLGESCRITLVGDDPLLESNHRKSGNVKSLRIEVNDGQRRMANLVCSYGCEINRSCVDYQGTHDGRSCSGVKQHKIGRLPKAPEDDKIDVQKDFDLAGKLGITGSPTLIMGDKRVSEADFATNTTNRKEPGGPERASVLRLQERAIVLFPGVQ